ncbi:hypothetical protein [Tellurirhabdus rosea]|uniref:hypothetical protein n=1 Tax=Tellurirhabdus rosea TaxID=2674997 RepID=UPI00225AD1F8|nr:hypothetical protein [Tellurirhabdus rosea]
MKKQNIVLELSPAEVETLSFLIRIGAEHLTTSMALRERAKVSLKDIQAAEKVRKLLVNQVGRKAA